MYTFYNYHCYKLYLQISKNCHTKLLISRRFFFYKTNVQLCVVETIDKISLEFI